jgi:hypothetical protein
MQDVSASVRDSVLDLIGKFILFHPPTLLKYFDSIIARTLVYMKKCNFYEDDNNLP